MTGKILIVDDEPDIRELLEITLGRMGLNTTCACSVASAKDCLARESFNLCLTDMRLPDGDGLDLVEYIQTRFANMPVVVITAHGSTETAVKALKNGAFDFVSKPVDLQKLRDLVKSAVTLAEKREPGNTSDTSGSDRDRPSIIGSSDAVVRMREQIGKFARSQAPVFISGPSGSGKELAARLIHEQSGRSKGPFVAVNCGAIPSDLMESELFGHLKGSFTGADRDKSGLFQAANGGTLFLDELADLPLHTQVKLLRVIQEKSVRPVGAQSETPINVRILSATHKDLAREVEHGRFRQDLYYRINVIELVVPSLRERIEDIEVLCEHILKGISKDNQVPGYRLTLDAISRLKQYGFPGNVRELENILQRAAMLAEGQTIGLDCLELNLFASPVPDGSAEDWQSPARPVIPEGEYSLEKHLESIEIKAIEKALSESRWNRTLAAKRLGMSFRALRYRLKKLGLDQ